MATRRTRQGRGGIEVILAELAQDAKTIRLKPGATVKDALVAAGYTENLEATMAGVRVDNQEVELTTRLRNGQVIFISPNVEGGR